jgi:predicted porin
MKKIVMATLLAATAFAAQAQVSVTGKVSMWGDSTSANGTRTTTLVTEPTSNIGFSVQEKLGNGLTARAVVETSLSGNTISGSGTQLGDRQGTVGVASGTASLDLGRNVHSQFLAITNNDAFGTLYGSVAGDVHNLRGLRMSQGVFVTLTPVKGLGLTYDRTQTGAGTEAQAYSASATLLGANATVAQYKQGNEESTVVGANYKLGAAQVFYAYSNNKGAATSSGNLVGVRYQLAKNMTAKASYGRTNTDVTAYALGLDYALSKRTEVGVAYRSVNASVDTTQLGVGVTHRF